MSLSSDDIVLAIMRGFEDEIPGRTLLQKVGYFIANETDSNVGYRAHYYGPYSAEIAAALNEQVSMGILTESCHSSSVTFEGHDGMRRFYKYALTDDGREAADIHRSWNSEEFDKAVKLARKIKSLGVDYMQLSFAAKTHFVLKRSVEKGMSLGEVLEAAKGLGWPMTGSDVDQGAKVLQTLGYIANSSASVGDN